VKRLKGEYGPMSTEDATYVIAHIEGLDLTTYLDPQTVSRVRTLIPRAAPSSTPASRKKTQVRPDRHVVIRIDASLPQVDACLSTTLLKDARKMAQVYPKYYVLENSIRVVIKRILENSYGNLWWQTRVAKPVRDTVADRMKKEAKQPWHGKRAQHEIFYSDFGDLAKIIKKNWSDFEDFFPSQPWVTQRLEELEHPRNVMAHHNPISHEDLRRIDLYFHDWVALLRNRRNLIP